MSRRGYQQAPEHVAARAAAKRASFDGSQKRCSRCGDVKLATEFRHRKNGRHLESRCRNCERILRHQWQKKNPNKVARRLWSGALKRKYGISADYYERLLISQSGRCAICGSIGDKKRGLAVDHNHATKQVRGLLCDRCNLGLFFFEDTETRERAMRYLCDWAMQARPRSA